MHGSGKMLKRNKQGMKDLAFPGHDLINGFNSQFVFCQKIPFIKVEKNSFENNKFVDIAKQCLALLPQVNFPSHNLNFH